MNKDSIVCLVSHFPDPLINKRLELLKQYYNVTILYNERGNSDFIRLNDVNYKKFSIKFENGKFIKRIFCLIKLKKEIKEVIQEINPKYIYAFRLDMLVMVLINGFKNKKIIYEVADLHNSIINNSKSLLKIIIRKVLYFIEKTSCKYINILSITSEKYYDVYFSKFISKEKVVFMPNIPNLDYFKNYKKQKHEKFTIGFIGIVRYKKQMKMLIEAAEKTKINILFAGFSQDSDIMNIAKEKKYIEYYGPYNYNDDIASLYSKCDCIYSVYDTKLNNVKYALPNKLYESIYCELPIIVSRNTYLSEIVNNLGVGVSVDSDSTDDLVDTINILKNDKNKYSKIVESCKKEKKNINMKYYNNLFIKKIKTI